MNILGVNALHGDAAAALVVEGQLVAAAAEERFNRQKHCAGFPRLAIEDCLREGGIRLRDLDHVGFSRNRWANLHRKIHHAAGRLLHPETWRRAARSVAVGNLSRRFGAIGARGLEAHTEIHSIEHHLSHAASAFFVSGFERAAILTLDGFGDFSSGLLGQGEGTKIRVLNRIHFPHSIGIYYTALTQFLGFPHYGDEGKVMALAALGKPNYIEAMQRLLSFNRADLVRLGLEYFSHHTRGVSMTWDEGAPTLGPLYDESLVALLGPPRAPGEPLDDRFHDIAASMQLHLEEIVLKLMCYLAELTGETNLCFAGGVALNSKLNGRICAATPFHELFIQPAASDDGTAIGCAFFIQHQILDQPRSFVMDHANWGPSFTDHDIQTAIRRHDLKARRLADPERAAALAIAAGKVVGWFQGRMEFGPRALGNRSILADPRRAEMKQVLNDRVKHREKFRPFAPSMLSAETERYFEEKEPSPFMLLIHRARKEALKEIPSALHVDGTARLQTVTSSQNARYYQLLLQLRDITRHGIVVNTSFNDSEPIVCTPDDAIHCFLSTRMDVLYLGDHEVMRPG